MLQVEIKVNGRIIATVKAVNQDKKGLTPAEFDDGWRQYLYEYDYPNHTKCEGTVLHFRKNGHVALIKEICEDLEATHGC
jgi:hypothetical protein